jgi:hypothetical protein
MQLYLQNLQAQVARSHDTIGLSLCACISASFQVGLW